ncbi:MAG: PqqD family protein [Candidatus Diapherotrites archaeon]
MAPEKVYFRGKNILRRTVGGKEMIVDIGKQTFYQLNTAGTFVWGQINGSRCTGEIAAKVAKRFGLPEGRAREDVESFLKSIEKEKLVRLKD